MTEDVADDLGWHAMLDLARGMGVPKHMRSEEAPVHAGDRGVLIEAVPDRTGCAQPTVGKPVADEHRAHRRMAWPLKPDVGRESLRDRIK